MMRKRKVFYEFVEVFKVHSDIILKVKIVTNKLFKFLSCFFFNNGFFQKINLHSKNNATWTKNALHPEKDVWW